MMAERAKAANKLSKTKDNIKEIKSIVKDKLPMLSNRNVDLKNLVVIKEVQLDEENIMGIRLPVVKSVDVNIYDYSYMGKPHWVDTVAVTLREMLILRIQLNVDERRLSILEKAVQRITQRVNLFDKVLIPQTQKNIKKIHIYLSDSERASVVTSKLSKKKHLRELPL